MQPEIIECDYYNVETSHGTETVLAEHVGEFQHAATLASYCGMATEIESGALSECRSAVARRIRNHRRSGMPVETLNSGKSWEMLDCIDGSAMVPDCCGVLSISCNWLSQIRNYLSGRIEQDDAPELQHGFLARLQEPGYLDSTDWMAFETELEAAQELLELYGSEDPEFAETWETELQEFVDSKKNADR